MRDGHASHSGAPFHAERVDAAGETRLLCRGEIDLASRETFAAAVLGAADDDGRVVLLVDLAEVTYMDSSGIRALIDARRLLDSRGRGMRVVNPSPEVRRVLSLTGLEGAFD